MNKIVKKVVFVSILFLSIFAIISNLKFTIKDEIYVVSESEENKKIDVDKNITLDTDKIGEEKNKVENKLENNNTVTVFVSGEVKTPGVVTLGIDKRLSDAIDELGGFTEDADLNKINLAIKIEDEKHYIIPKIGENTELSIENENYNNEEIGIEAVNNKSSLININTADIKRLDELPGVGEATANKIISYREEHGEFKMIEEIKNVNGIGEKKYEEIKELISVE